MMDYIKDTVTSIGQTRLVQWSINKVRENVYPWVYNKWEAHKILDDKNLWLGSLESACDRKALSDHGITHIVSAVYNINPIFPDDPELLYLKVPVIDEPNTDIAKHFEKAINFIDTALEKGEGVLVHCVYGVCRSSTLVCAYLIKKRKLTAKQAVEFVKSKRQQANPNSGFLTQLQVLESHSEWHPTIDPWLIQ